MQDFAIATIGSGKTAHLVSNGKAVCGIKGEFHHEVSAEQAHWDCKRCDNSLADVFRREALQAVQAEYAQINAELDIEDQELSGEIVDAMSEEEFEDDEVQARVDEAAETSIQRDIARKELRKSLVREYKLTKPMQRDLALSYQTALGSKDSMITDQALLVMCYDGMTSKGLRQRGLIGEGGRNGWATEEGFALAEVMYETEDIEGLAGRLA